MLLASSDTGQITRYGDSGWAVDFAGNSDFVNINATGGNFRNVNVQGKINATDSAFSGTLDCGSLKVKKAITYSILQQYTTNDYIELLYNYLENRGADITTKTVEQLFSGYRNPKMLYGSTEVMTVRLYKTSQTSPFTATFYHIVFNESIDIYDCISYEAVQIKLAYNWLIEYSNGETLTFMLEDLPTSRPTDSNIVYRDGNTLKIS